MITFPDPPSLQVRGENSIYRRNVWKNNIVADLFTICIILVVNDQVLSVSVGNFLLYVKWQCSKFYIEVAFVKDFVKDVRDVEWKENFYK